MTKEEIRNLFGDFTFDYKDEFFISTEKGNFVFSDPKYGGSGELKKYDGSRKNWEESKAKVFGPINHFLDYVCGDFKYVEK
jgi:hypothetical protein